MKNHNYNKYGNVLMVSNWYKFKMFLRERWKPIVIGISIPILLLLMITLLSSNVSADTGGTITIDGLYTVHTFLTNGTFNTTSVRNISILIVGGGGGAGGDLSGGGGGGQVIFNSSFFTTINNYTIVIGTGGLGFATGGGIGLNGMNTSFGTNFTAIGGGGGGTQDGNGSSGASGGGGGGGGGGTHIGGNGLQGNRGGNGSAAGPGFPSGGGGGAGAIGGSAVGQMPGAGGNGLNFTINGSNVYYGGGGGAGTINLANVSLGGLGGGGNGSSTPGLGYPGTNGTGGGGGGGSGGGGSGGLGGSGIVIIRYLTPINDATISFVTPPTINNGAINYYTNNSFNVSTISTMTGSVNTTFNLYNSTNNLIFTKSNLSQNYTDSFNNLSVGIYYLNATIFNSTNRTSTETRTITIYNITTNGINTPIDNQNVSGQFLNITWNATTITPTGTGVTITSYNISLRNNDGTLNRSITSTSNTFFNYNLYEQNLSTSLYRVRVQSIDSNTNSQYQETNFNLSTNTLLNITAKSITGATINTFSINAYNSLYNYNITSNTTNGVAYINQIKGLINLSIDADGFALNSNNSLASINVVAENYSYQFTLYQTNSINFTFYNQSDNKIMTQNVTFDLIGSLSAYTNLTTNGNIIMPLITPDDYTMRYTSPGFSTRFYRLTVTNRSYQNIDLYLINNNVAYNWTVYIVNEVLNPVEGATVKNLKYNLATNEYILQEIGVTDITGKTTFTVTFNDEYYKQIVEYPSGTLRKITVPDYVDTSSITIPITLGDNNIIEGLINYDGIGAIFVFNNATNNFRFDWTDTNQIASQYCVTIYNVSLLYGQVIYNSSCVNGASAGSVLLGVHNQSGLTYYGRVTYYESGVQKYLTSLYQIYPLSLAEEPLGNKYGLFIQMILTIGMTSLVVLNIGLAMILAPFSLILGKILGWNVFSWVGLFALQVVGIILAVIASTRK